MATNDDGERAYWAATDGITDAELNYEGGVIQEREPCPKCEDRGYIVIVHCPSSDGWREQQPCLCGSAEKGAEA